MPPSYPFVRAVLSFVALAISLSACGAKVEQKAPPLNPQARESYRLEVWAEDPPRPMQVESMQAVYTVQFVNCLPARAISGAPALDAEFLVPLRFEPTEGGRFASTVYADRLVSTDLYGRGECRWLLASVRTIWTDGQMLFRQSSSVVPINEESPPVESYSAFARESREMPEAGTARRVAVASASGRFEGVFPSRAVEDAPAAEIGTRSPDVQMRWRELSPKMDFLLRSRSSPLDANRSDASNRP